MIQNEVQGERPVDPAHWRNPRCASFLLQKDKGERGETQEVITRESTKEGGKQGERGWAEEARLGGKDKNSNRKNRGDDRRGKGEIRGQREHGDQDRVQKCSLRMVEEKEKQRDWWEDKKGGSGATVPWQQAVEAGKMAVGDTTPGQIWSAAPSSGLLSPTRVWMMQKGRRAATSSPVSFMCRDGMSDAGLGPNT